MSGNNLIKSSLLLMAVFGTALTFANKVKVLELYGTTSSGKKPQFSVYSSDGESYDTVDVTRTAQVEIGLAAECRKGARKNKQPYRGLLRIPGFKIIGEVSPPDHLIHNSNLIEATIEYAGGKGQARALTSWCNTKLEQLLADNPERTKYELMSEGFEAKAPLGINADYQLSCLSTGWGKDDELRSEVLIDARLRCESSDLAANKIPSGAITIKPMETLPMVAEVELKSNAEQFEGKCPVDFYFASKVTATHPGRVTYRFVDEKGFASEELELDFEEAGTQTTRMIRRHLGMLTGQSYTRLLADGLETVNAHLFADDEEAELESATDAPGLDSGALDMDSVGEKELPESIDIAEQGTAIADDLSASVTAVPNAEGNVDNRADAEETPAISLTDLQWDIQGSMTLEILSPDALRSDPKRFFVNCQK